MACYGPAVPQAACGSQPALKTLLGHFLLLFRHSPRPWPTQQSGKSGDLVGIGTKQKAGWANRPFVTHVSGGVLLVWFLGASHSYCCCVFLPLRRCLNIELVSLIWSSYTRSCCLVWTVFIWAVGLQTSRIADYICHQFIIPTFSVNKHKHLWKVLICFTNISTSSHSKPYLSS